MKHTPFQTWWEFVRCQNYQGRDKIGEVNVALACSGVARFDWEGSGVAQCVGDYASGTGEEGVKLFRESIETAYDLSISYATSL